MKYGDEVLLVSAVMIAFIGFMAGLICGDNDLKNRAIKAGVAHYTVDATTGKSTFTWKVCQ